MVGVPGASVDVRDGQVFVNGAALAEAYTLGATTCTGSLCHVSLATGQYHVLGDNCPNSADSRYWGAVAGSATMGTVRLRTAKSNSTPRP